MATVAEVIVRALNEHHCASTDYFDALEFGRVIGKPPVELGDHIAAAVAAHLASDAVVREVSRGICATICGRRPEDIEDDVINEFMDEARAAISGALGEHEGVK